jgi:hypothetical protein
MTQWGLDTLFNPAKRHMDEEKRRLQSTREEIGDSSGGKRIDLESGKVVIAKSTDDGSDTETDHSPDEGTGEAAAREASAKPKKQAAPESPAQARARARRAKKQPE